MKYSSLLIATLFLSAAGCSKFGRLPSNAGFTEVRLNRQAFASVANTPVLAGGMMIYASRADGYQASFKLANEFDEKIVSLPNGNYTFRALGWSGANLTGTTKCGVAGSTTSPRVYPLQGKFVEVPITVNSSDCESFSASAFWLSGAFLNPSLVFCSRSTDISGKGSLANCSGGEESSHFFSGRRTGSGPSVVYYNSASDRLGYLAKLHRDTVDEFFTVKADGTGTVRQNGNLPVSGGKVLQILTVPNSGNFLYVANERDPSQYEMFLSKAGTEGGTRLFPGNLNIEQMKITADGSYVVFVATDPAGARNLYSHNLVVGAAPIKISPDVGSGFEGMDTAEGDGGPNKYGYKLFPTDGNGPFFVLFVGGFSTSNSNLYHKALGSSAPALLLNSAAGAPGGVVQSAYNFDGTVAVWRSDEESGNGKYEIFMSSIANPTIHKVTTNPRVDEAGSFFLSPNDNFLIYSDTLNSAGQYSVRSCTFGASATCDFYLNHRLTTGSASQASHFLSTNDGRQYTFLYSGDGVGTNQMIWGFDRDQAGQQAVNVVHSSADSGFNSSEKDTAKIYQLAGRDQIFYLKGVSGAATKLYRATFAVNSGTPVASDLNPSGTSQVESFYSKDGYGFYSYKITPTTPPYSDAFSWAVGASVSVPQNAGTTVGVVLTVRPGESTNAFPNPLFFTGGPSTATYPDLFLRSNFLDTNRATSPIHRLTFGSIDTAAFPNTGYGRSRIALLGYRRTEDGKLEIKEENTVYGDCVGFTGNIDGLGSASGSRIPSGDGSASSPFAVAVDVFPHATDCTGPYTRKILPRGFAAALSPTSVESIKAASSGSAFSLFVKD